jgi:hypothetical protein
MPERVHSSEGLGRTGEPRTHIHDAGQADPAKRDTEPVPTREHGHGQQVDKPETEQEVRAEQEVTRLKREVEIRQAEKHGAETVTCVETLASPPDGGLAGDERRDFLHSSKKIGVSWIEALAAERKRQVQRTQHQDDCGTEGEEVLRYVDQLVPLCGLTFELRGERRDGAWPARRMMAVSASRAKCHAGASPLQRRVRPPRSVLPCRSNKQSVRTCAERHAFD